MRRTRRSRQGRSAAKRSTGFNLVALMDIFTILVFFLLVNTIEARELPSSQRVELPEARAEQSLRQTLTVAVTREAVLLDDRELYRAEDLLQRPAPALQALRQALAQLDPAEGEAPEVTVLGDRGLPFSVLKAVLESCTEAGFEQVSLAVTQKDQGGPRS